MRLPFLVLAIFAIAPPLSAQQQPTAPDSTAIAALDSLRTEMVRLRGFIRAAETQATKVLTRADATEAILRALPKPAPTPPDTVKPAPPPADTTPTPKPAPLPVEPMPASSVTLPQRFVDTTMPAITGRVLFVGASLQAALDSAQDGDMVALTAGQTYTGAFRLTACHARGVVVTTTGFPVVAGQRVTRADSVYMGRLVSPGANAPTLTAAVGSCGWRLVGVHVTAAPGTTVGALVSISGHSAGTVESQPRRIILDRMLVMGRTDQSFQRCVLGGGAEIAVIDSHLDECHGKGMDSQAFVAWQGPGPYLLQNNYLAGAGENVMFGGADSRSVELMPADIVVRGNHIDTPRAWKGVWTVKNLFELKVGRRVLVEGNVLEGSWADGQTGTALVMKTSNQSGTAPWSETSDVTVVGNLIRDAANGVNLAGRPEAYPAVSASRFHIANNVFASTGRHVMIQGVDSVTVTANTFGAGSHGVIFTGTQRGFAATANVFGVTTYAVTADARGYGSVALGNAAPGAVWERNAMGYGSASTMYPQPGTVLYKLGDALPVNTGATLDVAALIRRVVISP